MTIAASLNESFRDALVAYYLGEVVPNDTTLADLGLTQKLRTENDLYEFLLLDTQVTQAVETSPVASAIASLQQYVNGALLGMEPGYEDTPFSDALLTEWRDQRSQYPLWAAIRRHRRCAYADLQQGGDDGDQWRERVGKHACQPADRFV